MPFGEPEQLFHQKQRISGAYSGSGTLLTALKRRSNSPVFHPPTKLLEDRIPFPRPLREA